MEDILFLLQVSSSAECDETAVNTAEKECCTVDHKIATEDSPVNCASVLTDDVHDR